MEKTLENVKQKKENLDSNSWKAESQATDKENLNVDLIESCDNHLVNNIIINSSVTSDPSENVFYIKDLAKKNLLPMKSEIVVDACTSH